MHDWTRRFIDLARQAGALKLGRFELKSGRISPYFFNAGAFSSGALIAGVAACYADAIADAIADGRLDFDVLFGPAYKGIPLAAAVAVALFERHDRDVPVAYNRKEAKDHGEGGRLVGAPVDRRVLVVDDVISAGTAFGEAERLVARAGGRVCGLALGLDRQERGTGPASARSELEKRGVTVIPVATLDDLIEDLERRDSSSGVLSDMLAYRAQYGA
jgi:orotate phosphoribosyltransferase